MEVQEYLFDLHKDHTEWNKALDFYEDDLRILKGRLAEVSSKNTDQEVKMDVEKFQNQFIIQENEIDLIRHEINLEEDKIELNVQNNPVASDHRKMDVNLELIDRMKVFQNLFREMKSEFNDFIGKNI